MEKHRSGVDAFRPASGIRASDQLENASPRAGCGNRVCAMRLALRDWLYAVYMHAPHPVRCVVLQPPPSYLRIAPLFISNTGRIIRLSGVGSP